MNKLLILALFGFALIALTGYKIIKHNKITQRKKQITNITIILILMKELRMRKTTTMLGL